MPILDSWFRTSLSTLALFFIVFATTNAATFTVTNPNDSGTGSLRQAILDANATPGSDAINFSIGSGLQTIMPLASLPEITDSVVIDATTQPGFAGQPIIELDCRRFSANPNRAVLQITAGNSVVRGFVINRFTDGGIRLMTNGGNLVEGNYIGIDAAGTSSTNSRGNGISVDGSSNNIIGGTTPAARNVISATNSNGISIFGGAVSNTIQGNYIGTNAAGTAALGNSSSGVFLSTSNNIIGGTTAGARNIISANASGITIVGSSFLFASGNVIQGNYIGTNAAGTLDLGNSQSGVSTFRTSGTVIGGTTAGARNVISGNNFAGVSILANAPADDPASGTPNVVQGNYIGTNAAGTAPLGNTIAGVSIDTSVNTLIGGTAAGAGNIIAGTIGLNADTGDGLQLLAATNAVVQGNYIGTNAGGASTLGNNRHGVVIVGDSTNVNNIVGGTIAGAGNVIAFNEGSGVSLPTSSAGQAVRRNSIFSNGQLGIDLGGNGVTPNDAADPDTGANNLQNFPVVSLVSTGGSTTAQGRLNSTPNTSYDIELFANNGCDISGQGEGQFFLGATTANTDANGNATFSATFPTALAPGQVVTATATDSNGNTSEFSVCNEVDRPGRVQFSSNSYTATETSGSVTITVVRTFGTADTASVNYATSDGSATAGADYTPASGTLFFASGETMKTFTVQILDDSLGETPETVNLTLSNATGSTLGDPSTAVLTITDDEFVPEASVNSVTINEETLNGGATAVFTVRLSEASDNTVTVQYMTADGTAQANIDYMPVSGQITFTPGQLTRTINVPIIADTLDEPDETFFVILGGAVNASISTPQGVGTIIDNDPDAGTTGELLISEFRPSGPAGANDEFIEIYNNTGTDIDLRNYSLVFFTGANPTVVSFATLQGTTVLTPRSHRLLANSTGYSLSAYAGGSFFVTGADFFADNQGIALRRNGTTTQVDAVGFTDDAADFREGAGLPIISEFPATRPQYSYVRKLRSGTPQDTGDNAEDFVLVSTAGEMIAGVQSVLGAPGPQNRVTPVQRNAAIKSSLIDPAASPALPPNRIRAGSATGENAAYGTLTLRRKFTNTTGTTVTRLRFRVVEITTAGSPNPSGNPQADLRVLNSTDTVVDTSAGTITVKGTIVDQPPTQTMGGGLNSSLTVQLPSGGLLNNSSINVQFVLGVQEEGNFSFFVNVEALPAATVANPGVAGRSAQKGNAGKAREPQ